jgi:hypothetical protein
MKFTRNLRVALVSLALACGLSLALQAQGHRWTDQFHDVILFLWDGANTVAVGGTSINSFPTSQTFTAVNLTNALLENKGSRWSKVSTPAVSTQATASIAAEAAVRHVADCVSFSAGSTTAPTLTKLNVNLRDGATGTGTIIKSWTVVIPATTGQNAGPFTACGLNLAGTTNTAMTAEFSALLTNLFEDITLTGFNVQ